MILELLELMESVSPHNLTFRLKGGAVNKFPRRGKPRGGRRRVCRSHQLIVVDKTLLAKEIIVDKSEEAGRHGAALPEGLENVSLLFQQLLRSDLNSAQLWIFS